jgi:PAS domain S-box-containing protein
MTEATHHILVVEDDIGHQRLVETSLARRGFHIDLAKNAEHAISFVGNSQYDLVLIDLVLPDRSGLDLIADIKAMVPSLPIIIYSAFGSEKDAVLAIKKGANDFLSKSIGFEYRLADTILNTIKSTFLKSQISDAEARFEQIFHAANDFIFTLDLNGNFTSFNQKCVEEFGPKRVDYLQGKNFTEILPTQVKDRVFQAFHKILYEGITTSLYDIYIHKENKEKLFLELNTSLLKKENKIVGVLCVGRDITNFKEMQKKNREMQFRLFENYKLSSLGKMIQGIAHNLNTPLGTIMGRTELLQLRHPDLSDLDIILEQCENINKIIRSIVKKANVEDQDRESFWDIHYMIEEELKLLGSMIDIEPNLKIETNFDKTIPKLQFTYGHFSKSFHSFIENSLEAMLQSDLKVLNISTSQDSEFAYLRIQDTGSGIEEHNREKLFTAFFTTKTNRNQHKKPDSSLGLSLYNAYITLKPYGVQFDVKSDGDKTTFIWKVPKIRAENE